MFKSFMFYIFCPLYILCASFCCSEPPEPDFKEYSAKMLEKVSVTNNQKVFTVGDTLWINIEIPNTITDNNNELLNITELTGATVAQTNFVLLFQTQYNNLAKIRLSEDEIINDTGVLIPESYESFLSSEATLIGDVYTGKHGVLLLEPGIFTIQYAFSGSLRYGFSSEYNDNLINSITVETSFRSSENPNEYTFEVTN